MNELQKKIKALAPYERFRYYINERIDIRQRRKKRLPREEWTRDPILAKYKFTNARRAWDYTSQWLINNWYNTYRDHPSSGMAAAFARFFCYVPTLEAVGFPHASVSTWLEQSRHQLNHRRDRGEKVFTSAYIIGGVRAGHKKIDWVIREYLMPVHGSGALRKPWKHSIEDLHNYLHEFNGWGDFMTQEVVLDLMKTHVLGYKDFSERRMYGFAGPGAFRGLGWLNDSKERMRNRDEGQQQMRGLYQKLHADPKLREDFRQTLTVHDVEFNLCEFDKYNRTLFGTGNAETAFRST